MSDSGNVVPRKLPSSVVFGRYLLETASPGYVPCDFHYCVFVIVCFLMTPVL